MERWTACGLSRLAAVLFATASFAAIPESAYSDLRWRLVGPFRAGWATVVAGVPGDPATFYFGGADGGVWRTTDAGVTWTPRFDDRASASIGALAVAPSNPAVIWVGTGQIHQRWDIVAGDGVYRSTDAGAHWSHVGLADTRHIGAIWVDPRNADVAVVAALGHVFGPSEQRGLFRTDDGGKTWTRVLHHDADTGAADIAGDRAVPDVLYASLWQVRRHPWLDYFQPAVGAGSGIYKSSDGGRTWLAAGTAGLPEAPLGRIALGVAPGTGARRVWAAIDAPADDGLYRSDDGGATWTRTSSDSSLSSSYMNGVTPDPRNPDVVWVMGRSLRRSQDGGKTFTIVKGAPGGDDYHFLWIDPQEPRRMIVGSDQGAVVTLNGGESWSSWYNQPTGQFYRLATDDRFPYWIYGGQQDSGTVAIASRSEYGQLTFRDWHPVGGDERDGDVPDPRDPGVVYGAGLGGRLSRWDRRTGQVQNVSPWPVESYAQRPGTARYRYDWITPLAISKRPPHAIYVGAQVLFRSTDGGRSWATASPDLTGAAPDAKSCEGDVPVDRATACGFGAIFAITPSPAQDGLVWVGTDNGRIQLTRDDGKTWKDVTPAALADWTKVNHVDAVAGDPATAYVAADRHRLDDFRPIAFRTHDYGATWTEIGQGLPAGAFVGVVRGDPGRPGLLFAGTSRGVHVSFDDGDHWQSVQLNLPTSGVNDLLVHDDDVIVATQGRAIWVLDDIDVLRRLEPAALGESAFLAPPHRAFRVRADHNRDTPLPPEEPRGENPRVGAVIDYVLPHDARGAVSLEIVDAHGAVVRRFRSDAKPTPPKATVYFADLWLGDVPQPGTRAGHHRFLWDLRREPPPALEYEYSIAAVPGRPTPTRPQGALVLPGRYEVRLGVEGGTVSRPLEVVMDPRVAVSLEDLRALLAFEDEVESALGRATDLAEKVRPVLERLRAAREDPKARSLRKSIEGVLAEIERATATRDEDPKAVAGALAALASDLESADALPTEAQRQVLTHYTEALARFEPRWRSLAARSVAEIERKLRRGLGAKPSR